VKPLTGRVALVTGAGGGLGLGVRQALTDAGATIAQDDPGSDNPNWRWFDAADEADAKRAVDGVIANYGHVDILACLVGTWAPQSKIAELSADEIAKMFRTNFTSAQVMMAAVLPHMIDNGWGRVLVVGARQALSGAAQNGPYGASKAALLNLAEAAAAENHRHGITVNAVIPSTIDTPANRVGMPDADHSKWVKPIHIGELMAFLCTDAGGEINGARIPMWGRA
jgi:NAD(P)-dependent dehydrogenase (short-subunit alcohol dehydrogenase family)